jgi:hypothetical protein
LAHRASGLLVKLMRGGDLILLQILKKQGAREEKQK